MPIYKVTAISNGARYYMLFAPIGNPYYKQTLSYVSLCRDAEEAQDCAIKHVADLVDAGWKSVLIKRLDD